MANSQKVRFALIGCGAIALKHVTALRRLEEAELVGACDKSPERAAAFGKQHNLPTFSDAKAMVEAVSPDVLNILTPSGCHTKDVLDLVSLNRHFVVEKPLGLRIDEIDRVLEECDKYGLKIFVVKQNRFNPPVRKLKEAIDKGRFKRLVLGTVRVRWRRDQAYYDQSPWRGTWAWDGGVLTNQASHHIDLLLWLMGDVESVIAKTSTRLAKIEAEDTGVAILKFRNGALGIIEATTAVRPKDLEGSVSVLGEGGSVEIGGFFANELKTWAFSEPDAMDDDIWTKHARIPDAQAWSHSQFFSDVIHSLRGGGKALIHGLEGRRSIELINALYESADRNEEIHLRYTPRNLRLGLQP